MNNTQETAAPIPKSVHLAICAGSTTLAGVALGLEAGLIEKSPDVGVYMGLTETPVIALITFIAVEAWKAYHDDPQ
jgi:hypothetical protein